MLPRTFLTLLMSGVLLAPLFAADDYPLGPDSQRKPDVPRGTVKQFKWTSKVFADTERDCWVYTPAGYTREERAHSQKGVRQLWRNLFVALRVVALAARSRSAPSMPLACLATPTSSRGDGRAPSSG